MSERVFDTWVTKKGQIVIPKPLRDRFRIRENSRVRLVATEEGVLIRPALQEPSSGLRGVLRGALSIEELDRLLDEVSRRRQKLAMSAGKTVRKMRDERSKRLLGYK